MFSRGDANGWAPRGRVFLVKIIFLPEHFGLFFFNLKNLTPVINNEPLTAQPPGVRYHLPAPGAAPADCAGRRCVWGRCLGGGTGVPELGGRGGQGSRWDGGIWGCLKRGFGEGEDGVPRAHARGSCPLLWEARALGLFSCRQWPGEFLSVCFPLLCSGDQGGLC